jgi:phosphoribosylformylglycinamidine synthase
LRKLLKNQKIRDTLRKKDLIVFQYCNKNGIVNDESNPNGSEYNIAGICNLDGTILGMMPHPERCSEEELGSIDGRLIFESLVSYLERKR